MSITVVIPCFEQEKYLQRCLLSVLPQTQPGDEVIVVTEQGESGFLWHDYYYDSFDGDLSHYTNAAPRRGISFSRNFGVSKTSGDWIKFLDADDMLAPFALESFRQTEIPSKVAVVSGAMYQTVSGKTKPTVLHTNWSGMGRVNPSLVSACFIRRSAFVEVGGFDDKIGFEEDWDLWLKLSKANHQFARVEWPVCFYWIDEAERAAKVRDHSVEYQGHRIDVREYFRRHYGINPL